MKVSETLIIKVSKVVAYAFLISPTEKRKKSSVTFRTLAYRKLKSKYCQLHKYVY
jgi:hypothetical protein